MSTAIKFPLGRVVATPDALQQLTEADVLSALRRHASGDWGDCSEQDKRENDLSVTQGFRIVSVYHSAEKTKFWVITEADRSATTVLLPANY